MSDFSVGDNVVYSSHGVGTINKIERQSIAGIEIEVYVISFEHDNILLRVPTKKAAENGLRKISSKVQTNKALEVLLGKAQAGARMWSKRAQEYENKINSGNIILLAEVIRDLYKQNDAERSYSERTIYESAIKRLSSELAVTEKISEKAATERVLSALQERVAV